LGITLTIGMATHCDYQGLWATITTLRLHQRFPPGEIELLVADNAPDTLHGKAGERLFEWFNGSELGDFRWIPCGESQGTAAPRQRIFEEAQGDYVAIVDCHVDLVPGSIRRLLGYYRKHPLCNDLLSGPMLYDDLKTLGTHWHDAWRAKMWGHWETDVRAYAPACKPFPIWGCGLGCFSMRRAAWPGFNSRFRGFGGEEGYIHEKVRQRGGKCLCLPWLRWAHRTGPNVPVQYVNTVEHRIRNYLLGHRELGLDLERCRYHYVEEEEVPQQTFDAILADVDAGRDEPWETGPVRVDAGSGAVWPPPGVSVQYKAWGWSEIAMMPAPETEAVCQSFITPSSFPPTSTDG
jgi:glycosyl transferase family 2